MSRAACVMMSIVGLAILGLSGCDSGNASSSVPGWEMHRDEIGFEVSHPRGWSVEAVDHQWIWIRQNEGTAFAVIFPFLSPQPTTARHCARDIPRLLQPAFPALRVQNVTQNGQLPDEAIATLAYEVPEIAIEEAGSESEGEKGGLIPGLIDSIQERLEGPKGKAVALCSVMLGRSGMFYAIGSHQELFESDRDTLIKILDSFRFTQPPEQKPKPPADQDINYVRWTDPIEAAYSVEVPRGWQIQGGTFRGGPAVDVRHAYSAVSPDNKVQITVGDAEIPPYVIPTSISLLAGQLPGSWYDPGYGVKMMVMPYLSGRDYASQYANEMITRWCPEVRQTSLRNRGDIADRFNQIYQQSELAYFGVLQEMTVGDVAFTCAQNGAARQGYYLVGTAFVGQMSGFEISGVWNVELLYGYVAAEESVELAEAVIAHMVESFGFNPQWVQMQQQLTAAVSGIVAETGAEIAETMNNSYWSRQETYNEIYRNWSNATLGLTDVRDEETGETWKVASGHNYYWRLENTDVVVGENVGERPDINFSLLREY